MRESGLSVVMLTPCRNAAATIDEAIWSVASQTGGLHIRYHVQDGASTDGTHVILATWAERLRRLDGDLPSRVEFTWSSTADGGLYDALARSIAGLDMAPETFMGWINADDVLWPGALRAVAEFGRDRPECEWLTGLHTLREADGRVRHIVPEFFPREVLAAGWADGECWPFMQQESTFWRKRLYDRAGGLDTTLRLAADWDLWRRFARQAELVHLRRQLGAFTVRPGQLSADKGAYRLEVARALAAVPARYPAPPYTVLESRPEDGRWSLERMPLPERKRRGWRRVAAALGLGH